MSRILLVEDNPSNRKLLGGHLRRAGHEVRETETAEEALSLARREPLDLVVMDIQLPGTDGLTATRLLRADPRTRHLPVLAVTAHAMQGDESRILAAGCSAYTAKPVAYKEFLTLVAELLANARTKAEEKA